MIGVKNCWELLPSLLFPVLEFANPEFDPALYVGHRMTLVHIDSDHTSNKKRG